LRELIKTVPNESLSTSIQLLLQASADAVHAKHAVLLLAQPDAGLQLHDALGFSDQAEAAGDFVLNVGDTFAWRVATERQTLVDSLPMFEGASPHGFIGTPLILRDQVLGVLIAYPLSSVTVDPVEVAWLESFAAQGALAIQLSRLEVENQRLTPNDPLTGALKQAVFLDVAEHEFRRSWRYSQAISVIVVTVEGLAGIYSTNSRQVGDQVLRQVASLCRRTVRSIDLVGRLDDDSIALLLLMTDRADAKGAAERVRAAIGSINLSGAQGPLRITASLGVCSYPRENCASIYDLLEVTKQAQRAAQRSGLNQMVQV
jgi:diguanylate cyclase (GGDEF)-like protein